jgi:hypothetical protein
VTTRTLVAAAGAVLALAGCASGESQTTGTTRAAAPASHHARQRHRKRSPLTTWCCSGGQLQPYAGLGSPRHTYVANNTQAPPNPAGAPEGIAWYQVLDTNSAGRVTAAQVTIKASPPMGDRERMALLLGEGLPDDAREADGGTNEAVNNNTCEVWESRKLKTLTGDRYAKVTTETGTATASITLEPTATC